MICDPRWCGIHRFADFDASLVKINLFGAKKASAWRGFGLKEAPFFIDLTSGDNFGRIFKD